MLFLLFSSNLGNATSLIFGYAAADDLGDHQGSITLGGCWAFLLLGSNGCCIGLSKLVGGIVLSINGVSGWSILDASFNL